MSKIFTIKEAAEFLDISESTMRRFVQSGDIKPDYEEKVSRGIKKTFDESTLLKFKEERGK